MEKNVAVIPAKKAYWSNYARGQDSSDESESIVPGVKVAGNRRPNKMQGRKTKEIKAKIPIKQPVVEELCPTGQETSQSCDDSSSVVSQTDKKQSKQVSLKDLSEVDKKRIANLVKELARMGEEREKAVGQLHTERQQFEKQVLQLVEQQERILNEREDIQSKLFQCQDLLTKYQDKIMEKQVETKECPLSQLDGTLSDSDKTFGFNDKNDMSELPSIHLVTPCELNTEVSIRLPEPSVPRQLSPDKHVGLFSPSSNPETVQSKSEKSKPVWKGKKSFKKFTSKKGTSKISSNSCKTPTSNSQIVMGNSNQATHSKIDSGNSKAATHSKIDSGNSKAATHSKIDSGNSKMSKSKKNDKISKNRQKKAKWTSPVKDPWVANGRYGKHSQLEKIVVHPFDSGEINLIRDITTVGLLEKISWLDPKRDEISRGKVDKRAKSGRQGTKAMDIRKTIALKRHESRSRSPDDVYPSPRSSDDENYHKTHHHSNAMKTKSYPLRPFTSKIDKEIALQRSFNEREGLSTILSERLEQNTRKRIEYMDKLPVMKAFREPIMSSTQKSSELNPYSSSSQEGNFEALVPDSSPRSSQVSELEYKPGGIRDKENCRAKVGFKDKLLEFDHDNAKLHSPNLGSGSGVFGDKSFMKYYKKLSQTDRKRELLRQRESLLDEQRRLKDILRIQEKQLRNKQEQLHQQQTLQQQRLAYFEKNGKFPLGKLEVDTENKNHSSRLLAEKSKKSDDFVQPEIQFSSPRTLPSKPGSTEQRYTDVGDDGSLFGGEVKRLNFDRHADEINEDDIEEEAAAIVNETPRPARTTTGTSPIHRSQLNPMSAHSIATSPIRMDQSIRSAYTPTRQMDAATSISRENISPRSQKSTESVEDLILGRQGNLPLQSNRGRSSQSPVASAPHTPGEKTLSVMEIVNSMDQSPSWSKSHTQNQFGTPPLRVTKAPAGHDEEEEESRLLEDVFFLRG